MKLAGYKSIHYNPSSYLDYKRDHIKKVFQGENQVYDATQHIITCYNAEDLTQYRLFDSIREMESSIVAFMKNKIKSPVGYIKDCTRLFEGFQYSGTEFDISEMDTSGVNDMDSMFKLSYYKKLTGIESLNVSDATRMDYMFSNTNVVDEMGDLDLSGWNVSNCEYMNSMFAGSGTLYANLNLSGWDISNVTSMNRMFESLTNWDGNLDLSGWDMTNRPNISNMFSNCNLLSTLDLSTWDMSAYSLNDSYLNNMFVDCLSLTTCYGRTQADCDILNSSSNKPENVNFIVKEVRPEPGTVLYSKTSPKNTPVTETWTPEFEGWVQFEMVGAGGTSPGGWQGIYQYFYSGGGSASMYQSFHMYVKPTTTYTIYNGSQSKITFTNDETNSLETIYVENGKDGEIVYSNGYGGRGGIAPNIFSSSYDKIVKQESINGTNGGNANDYVGKGGTIDFESSSVSQLFKDNELGFGGTSKKSSSPSTGKGTGVVITYTGFIPKEEGYSITYTTTTNSTPIKEEFNNTQGIKDWIRGNKSVLKTMKVVNNPNTITDMESMFESCANLTSLDLSNFDTSNVTSMKYMFNYCPHLTSLDLSNFDTSSVNDMQGVFNSCHSLTSLDLSNFDTSSVTNMYGVFGVCSSLTSLDVTSFDTSNVTDMPFMFDRCSSLTSLDLSSFDTSSVRHTDFMFSGCSDSLTGYGRTQADCDKLNTALGRNGFTVKS